MGWVSPMGMGGTQLHSIATLQLMNNSDSYTNWQARPGWLILLPSRSSPKSAGGILIPDSETKKTNSGICIKAGVKIDEELFLGKECFFANHTEYGVRDTETGWELYVIDANKIIMIRTPPPEIARFSREKGEGLTFQTVTHDQ
jgi:co-chaperonin GroES (HSP10)